MDQSGREVTNEALLKRATRRDIAVANGEDRFLRVECWPPELCLAYKPGMVHQMLSSRMHRREAPQNVRQRYAGQIGQHEVGLAYTLNRTETHSIHAGDLGCLHSESLSGLTVIFGRVGQHAVEIKNEPLQRHLSLLSACVQAAARPDQPPNNSL